MPPNDRSLDAAVVTHRNLREQLLATWPELGDDEQAMADTLEGLSDFNEQCLAVMRLAVERETHAEAMAMLIKRMQERKARLESGAEKMRAVVLHAMSEAGVSKIPGADMTLSVGWGPAPLIITEPDKVPDELSRITRAPNLTAIKELLGQLSPEDRPGWAMWGNPRQKLTVRQT